MLDSSGMPTYSTVDHNFNLPPKRKLSTGTRIRNSKVRAKNSEPSMSIQRFLVQVERIHGDEENLLQHIEKASQEAVLSCLSLHWVNDLPGAASPLLSAPTRIDISVRCSGAD